MSAKIGFELTRIMASTIQDWPDVVALLQRLIKCIARTPTNEEIDEQVLIKLFKKCHLFMNPKLPAGVHAKVMELFKLIWSIFNDSEKQIYLQFMVLSLQSFGLISMKMKATMIEVFDLFLQVPLGSCSMPIMASILPGIEEEQSETFLPCMQLLTKICQNINESYFYTSIWHIIINYPECRIPALFYLIKKLPNPVDKEDFVYLFSNDQTIVVSAFEACFHDTDPSGLIHRNALDVLLFMDPLLFASPSLHLLLNACLNTLLKRDMSLNKRLFQFICPNEPQYIIIEPVLITVLKSKCNKDPNNSFKIYASLLDKPLILKTISNLINFIIPFLASYPHNIPSAQLFLNSMPRHILYHQSFLYLQSNSNEPSAYLSFYNKYPPHLLSDKSIHIPLFICLLLSNITLPLVPIWIQLLNDAIFSDNPDFPLNLPMDAILLNKYKSPIPISLITSNLLVIINNHINTTDFNLVSPFCLLFIHLSKSHITTPLGPSNESFAILKSHANDPTIACFMLLFRYFQFFKIKSLAVSIDRISILWHHYITNDQYAHYITIVNTHILLLDTFMSLNILQQIDQIPHLHKFLLIDPNQQLPKTLFVILQQHLNNKLPNYQYSQIIPLFPISLFIPIFNQSTLIPFNSYYNTIYPINYAQYAYICNLLSHFITTTAQPNNLEFSNTMSNLINILLVIPDMDTPSHYTQFNINAISLLSLLQAQHLFQIPISFLPCKLELMVKYHDYHYTCHLLSKIQPNELNMGLIDHVLTLLRMIIQSHDIELTFDNVLLIYKYCGTNNQYYVYNNIANTLITNCAVSQKYLPLLQLLTNDLFMMPTNDNECIMTLSRILILFNSQLDAVVQLESIFSNINTDVISALIHSKLIITKMNKDIITKCLIVACHSLLNMAQTPPDAVLKLITQWIPFGDLSHLIVNQMIQIEYTHHMHVRLMVLDMWHVYIGQQTKSDPNLEIVINHVRRLVGEIINELTRVLTGSRLISSINNTINTINKSMTFNKGNTIKHNKQDNHVMVFIQLMPVLLGRLYNYTLDEELVNGVFMQCETILNSLLNRNEMELVIGYYSHKVVGTSYKLKIIELVEIVQIMQFVNTTNISKMGLIINEYGGVYNKPNSVLLYLINNDKFDAYMRVIEEKLLILINDEFGGNYKMILVLIYRQQLSFSMYKSIYYEIYEHLKSKTCVVECLKLLEYSDYVNNREYECFKHLYYPRHGMDVEDEYHRSVLMDVMNDYFEYVEIGQDEVMGMEEEESRVASGFLLIGEDLVSDLKIRQVIQRIINPTTRYHISVETLKRSIEMEITTP